MKTTRFQAQKMLEALRGMALGHLASETLEKVLDNIDVLKAEIHKVDTLKAELVKRVYQGVPEERLQSFFIALQKGNTEVLNADFIDLAPLREKELEVIVNVYNKVVDLDIVEVNGKAFKKAVIAAQPEIRLTEFDVLSPMFITEEKPEADIAELEELLK